MTQGRVGERLDVVDGDVGLSAEQRAGLAAENEELSCAQAGAPADPFIDEAWRAFLLGPGGRSEPDCVLDDLLGDRHFAHNLVKLEHVLAVKQRFDGFRFSGGGASDHFDLVGLGEVVDHDVEHESIQLRLGQRIGAFHFDRILGRQHEERLLEHVAGSGGGYLVLLHRLEQRGLGLGRRAVNFVGEDHVGENGAVDEDHAPALLGVLENLRARDVGGHQIGRKLNSLKFEMENLRDGFDEQGLGEAGRAGDEAMPTGEKRGEDLLDDVFLADDDLGEFRVDLYSAGDEFLDRVLVRLEAGGGGFRRRRWFFRCHE